MTNQTPEIKPGNNLDDIQFFAEQKKIYPRSVKGYFRNLKWLVIYLTLGLYYIAPFIRFDRGEHAPDQAILLDIPARRAYFFFIEIWPQEVYVLTGVLILSAFLLFFVTSLFGRVWCGYFCPQTVWTDLFIWVEKMVQGDRGARKRLQEGPWKFEKFWKLGLTHVLWVVISVMTGGAFVLYFTDAPTFFENLQHLDITSTQLGFIVSLTASTYLMAGFAREQVCTYMCPYARFQSAMFDENTLIITYDERRGEPRGKPVKGQVFGENGHCIDCTACVQVCPMGIDIRNGLQMECIACGLCIDACDEVMDKVGLPRGLVRYDTTRHMALKQKGIFEKFRLIRPRTIYYMIVLTVASTVLLSALIFRSPVQLNVLHDRNPLFVQLSDGTIRNGYEIKILNKTHDEQTYQLTLNGIDNASLDVRGAGNASADRIVVRPGDVGHYHVFISAPAQQQDRMDILFTIKSDALQTTKTTKSLFISRDSQQ